MSEVKNFTFFNPVHSSNNYDRSCDNYLELLIASEIAALNNQGQCFTTADFTDEQAKMVCQIFINESHGHLLCEVTGHLHLVLYVKPDAESTLELMMVIPAVKLASDRKQSSAMLLGLIIGALSGANDRAVYARLQDASSHARNHSDPCSIRVFNRDALKIFMTEDDLRLLDGFLASECSIGMR